MKKLLAYPFYKSLRFRFGLIFGFLFLCCLLSIAFFLYSDVQQQLEKSFTARLYAQANIILQKTEISPLMIPLPGEKEYYLLTYNNTKKKDTLLNNLPRSLFHSSSESQYWRSIQRSITLETGGIVTIVYALPAADLNKALERLRKLLFVCIPVALLVSFVVAYFLSGFLLKPVTNIISIAKNINLQNDIQLIDEPKTKDELHQLVVTLNRMLERLQSQSQQQNAFFASASHELRTPLSNMLTGLQVMQSRNISTEIKTVFENQVAEVQRLKKLVNDFLLMSQLKAGAVHVNKTMVDMAELFIECAEKIRGRLKEKGQTFKIALIPEEADFTVFGDANHLQIAFNNLLANAVKYGSESTVISSIIIKAEDNITVRITNQTDVEIVNVQQLTKEFARNDFLKEGFGLGLWITEKLAGMNNGELVLSSGEKTFMAGVKIPLR